MALTKREQELLERRRQRLSKLAQSSQSAQPSQQPQSQLSSGLGGFLLDVLPFGRVAEKTIKGQGDTITGGELLFEALTAIPLGRLAKLGKVATAGSKAAKAGSKASKILPTLSTAKAGSPATFIGKQKIASTGLEDAISATDAGRDLFSQDRINRAAQTVFKRFSAKSPTAIKRQLPEARDAILKERDSILSGIKNTVPSSVVRKDIGRELAKFDLSNADVKKIIETLSRNIPGVKTGKSLSAVDLAKMQRKLNQSVKGSVFEGVAPNRAEDIKLAIKEALDIPIERIAPPAQRDILKRLNRELSDMFIINKAGIAGGKGSVGAGPIGLPRNLLRGAQRRVSDQGERLLGRQVTPGSALGQFALAEAASSLAQSPSQGILPAEEAPSSTALSQALTEDTPPTNELGVTPEMIQQLMLQDLQQTGGQNIDQIEQLAEILGLTSNQEAVDLTATQTRDLAVAQDALDSVNRIEELLTEDPGSLLRAGIPGGSLARTLTGTAELNAEIQNAIDALVRARSGAQINEQEFKRLRPLLPETFDSPEVALAKLNRFKQTLNSIIQAPIGAEQGTLTVPGAF